MAVSGATYTALIAFRNVFSEDVKQLGDDAEVDHKTVKASKDSSISTAGCRKYAAMMFWMRPWRWAQAAPATLFLIIIYVVVINLLYRSWDDVHALGDDLWPKYKWCILGLLVADFFALCTVPISYCLIRGRCKDLKEWAQKEENDNSKQLTAKPAVDIDNRGEKPAHDL